MRKTATLAARLRKTRIAAELTQAELAAKIGKGQSLIANIELGILKRPSCLQELADALGVDAEWLKGDEKKAKK